MTAVASQHIPIEKNRRRRVLPGFGLSLGYTVFCLSAIVLIPLALRGVKYRPQSAGRLLARNLVLYGAGGVIVPFIGIKAIDLLMTAIGIV